MATVPFDGCFHFDKRVDCCIVVFAIFTGDESHEPSDRQRYSSEQHTLQPVTLVEVHLYRRKEGRKGKKVEKNREGERVRRWKRTGREKG